jgi:prevent-host-death family protein
VNKVVDIKELREHLGEYVQSVKDGDTVTLVEGEEQVARLVPMKEPLVAQWPTKSLADWVPPPPLEKEIADKIMELFREDRNSR